MKTLSPLHSITVGSAVCGVDDAGTTACKDSQGRANATGSQRCLGQSELASQQAAEEQNEEAQAQANQDIYQAEQSDPQLIQDQQQSPAN